MRAGGAALMALDIGASVGAKPGAFMRILLEGLQRLGKRLGPIPRRGDEGFDVLRSRSGVSRARRYR
jgi:hypothetical protein